MSDALLDALLDEIAPLSRDLALERLLAAFRDRPDELVAEAIVRLEGRTRREGLEGSLEARIAAMDRLVDEGTGAAIGRAIRAFPVGVISDATRQLERLARRPDPRLGQRIATLLDDPPYRSPAARAFWQQAFEAVVAAGDTRALRMLSARRAQISRELAQPMKTWVPRDLDAALAPLAKLLATPPREPTERWRQHLDSLASWRLADVRADELLDAIHADPQDDSVRAVYADRLIELGDPRGELIALQLHRREAPPGKRDRAAAAREKELLQKHEREWLGELAPVVLKSGCKFERGFLDACELKAKSGQQIEKLIGHPSWATVRAITAGGESPSVTPLVNKLLLHPVMQSLHVLDGDADRALFRELFLGETPRPLRVFRFGALQMSPHMSWGMGRGWTVLPPGGPTFAEEDVRALTEAPALPDLRQLDITGAYQRCPPRFLRWLLDGALAQRLERLRIMTDEALIPEWIDAIIEHPLAELVIAGQELDSTYAITRDDAGRPTRVSVSFRACNQVSSYRGSEPISAFNDLLRMLELAARGTACPLRLSLLELAWPAREPPTAAQLARLDVALANVDVERCVMPTAQAGTSPPGRR